MGKMALFLMNKYTGKNPETIGTMLRNLAPEYTGNIQEGYKLSDREIHLKVGDYLTFSYVTGFKVYSASEIETEFRNLPVMSRKRFWLAAIGLSIAATVLAVGWSLNEKTTCFPTEVIDHLKVE
jgi:hypothetical protein